MREWRLHTVAADDGLRLERHTLLDTDLTRGPGGELWWLMRPPAVREWREGVGQLAERAAAWRLVEEDGSVALRVAEQGAEADVLELRGAAADAFLDGRDAEPLTVIGPYRPLGAPRDVAAHLSARGPLLPPFGPGTRRISEQLALSLYRIACHRGGPFWNATADWIAEWGVARADLPEVHHHLRFLADLALLLAAAEKPAAADRALDELEALAVPVDGGRWYRHDRDEVAAGRNDLVLNTHLRALLALAARGRPLAAGLAALDHALALRAPRARGMALAGLIAATDLASAARGRGSGAAAWRLHEGWGQLRAQHPHLTLVRGLVARDPRPNVAGRYYRTVNLADLAALVGAAPTPSARTALCAGLRLARASRFFTVQRRAGDYMTVVVPSLLRLAGHPRAAERAADAARASGWAPALGWPGYVDAPWPSLPPGIP